MKPWPRTRKCVKWGGAVVTVLLVAAWVGSFWWSFGYRSYSSFYYYAAAGRGYVYGGWLKDRGARPSVAGPSAFFWEAIPTGAVPAAGWPSIQKTSVSSQRDLWQIRIPYWLLVAPTLAATCWACRLDHLARKHSCTDPCPACGYSRTGLNPGSRCPECGKPESAPA